MPASHTDRRPPAMTTEGGIAVVPRFDQQHFIARLEHAEHGHRRSPRYIRWSRSLRDRHRPRLRTSVDTRPRSLPEATRSPRAARIDWDRRGPPRKPPPRTSSGPSKSGKPCPRLIASCRAESADISEKIELPYGRSLVPSPRSGITRPSERVNPGGSAPPSSRS